MEETSQSQEKSQVPAPADPAAHPAPEPHKPHHIEHHSSEAMQWFGRVLTFGVAVFILLDLTARVIIPASAKDFVQLGFPSRTGLFLIVVLTVSACLYVIPRTAILGALLLTGYLGGAVIMNLRIGNQPFETFFPLVIGLVVWVSVYMRDHRLHVLAPWR
jgi:hypothetical protein